MNRASPVVNCQSIFKLALFLSFCQVAASLCISGKLSIRRSKHWRVSTLSSISAILSRLEGAVEEENRLQRRPRNRRPRVSDRHRSGRLPALRRQKTGRRCGSQVQGAGPQYHDGRRAIRELYFRQAQVAGKSRTAAFCLRKHRRAHPFHQRLGPETLLSGSV